VLYCLPDGLWLERRWGTPWHMAYASSLNEKWTAHDIPDLIGKTVVVTGANSGTGFAGTQALLRKRAHVVMACRSLERAETALTKIRQKIPDASAEIIQLDLANLSSIRDFAQEFNAKHQSLHILLNNAGIMIPPKLKTVDGFELQLGTNHLGHFALTGLLLERIMNTEASRVVTMSSSAAESGKINFDDLQWDKSYSRFGAYSQSKLANLLFAHELHRRLRSAGSNVLSLCSHPGGARTNLFKTGLGMSSGEGTKKRLASFMTRALLTAAIPFIVILTQSADDGALPMLYAATSPNAESGAYYGPSGIHNKYPKRVESSQASHDEEVARRLWEVSTELTGVKFNI
jgi:NAD(P)-dependent dehydrogenase (short-subunit alcohol dehydrogenase family)